MQHVASHAKNDYQLSKRDHPQAERSKFVNELFLQKDGRYDMQLDNQYIAECRQIYSDKYHRKEASAMRYGICLHQVFHGNVEAMQKSIADGEIKQYEEPDEPGVQYYVWASHVHGQVRGEKGIMELKQDL